MHEVVFADNVTNISLRRSEILEEYVKELWPAFQIATRLGQIVPVQGRITLILCPYQYRDVMCLKSRVDVYKNSPTN